MTTAAQAQDEAFARSLVELRKVAGFTQTDVARLMTGRGFRFHQPTMQRIEAGDRPVRLSEAFALADILGADLLDMTGETGRAHITPTVVDHIRDTLAGVESTVQAAIRRLEVAHFRDVLADQAKERAS